MPLRKHALLSITLAMLPLLTACNQTVPPEPGVIGSGALAAINEAQATQVRHRVTSFALNQAASFDPTGLSGYGVAAIEEEQARIEEEQSRRIDEESAKALAQADAAAAETERLERQKASAARRTIPSRKPNP